MTVVVTIGVFDGYHRGHAAVVSRARKLAHDRGGRLVVFTFDCSPAAVLGERREPLRLTLPAEKFQLLRETGVDEVRVLRFTRELAAKPPRAFLEDHLLRFDAVEALVVGYDFALGRNREGGTTVLRGVGEERGFAVEGVGPVSVGGRAISSTRIRAALDRGDVEEAKRLLGRPYRVRGEVVTGEGRGREIGFPTANLEVDPRKQKPASGVYAVWVSGIEPRLLPGAVNLGVRPTFGGGKETVEVHVLEWKGALPGKRVELRFVGRIRSEVKFMDFNQLKRQIEEDVITARALLEHDLDTDNTA